jgi:phosphotransferase system, enzyme I, PtsP
MPGVINGIPIFTANFCPDAIETIQTIAVYGWTYKMPRQKLHLLEDICGVITGSRDPRKTLDTIVELVAERFSIDVCSVYIFDAEQKYLVLTATVGLNRAAIGSVGMHISEGLSGLVLETMAPVFVRNPSTHPRYKYFKESGEEIYRTFLGLPLIYHQRNLGVLVVQTAEERAISEADIPVFSAITSQVAATVAYSGLLADLNKDRSNRPAQKPSVAGENTPRLIEKKPVLRGIAVSSGFAQGRAHYLAESIGFDQVKMEAAENHREQRIFLEKAFEAARHDIRQLHRAANDLTSQDASIIEANLMILEDAAFRRKICDRIDAGYTAAAALKQVVLQYLGHFNRMADPYLRQRGADIVDAGKQVLANLLAIGKTQQNAFNGNTIVIAADISAAELIRVRQPHLKGIILAKGGKTSHAVILAKSFEIPMIIGVKDVLDSIRENDRLIVDGTSGLIFRDPPPEICGEYDRLRVEKENSFRDLDRLRDVPALTRDGRFCRLGANVSLLSDLELVHKYGADHIGLYRTEFPFLVRGDFPTEEEQFDLYCKVIAAAAGKTVTIRTLDVGGDKFFSHLDYPKETNPYLGWRAVRVSLEHEDIFRTQIRAVLRASACGPASLMFPMISTVEEVSTIKRIVEDEKSKLAEAGRPFDANIALGIMVEVPAAVRILHHLLTHVDFASIGTNGLTQYILAVDRNNEKVSALYNPLHPAVIATIREAATVCRRMGMPLSICGESASNPYCVVLYVAMGITRLSMNPASIPLIKRLMATLSMAEAQSALMAVADMEDAARISDHLRQVCSEKIGAYLR